VKRDLKPELLNESVNKDSWEVFTNAICVKNDKRINRTVGQNKSEHCTGKKRLQAVYRR